MKQIRLLPFITGLLLIIYLFTIGTACAGNLLENADFTEMDSDGLPAGWYTDAYILEAGYTRFQYAEGDADHPCAVSIQNIGENDARFAQTVEVEPDSLYLFSGYIRAEGVEGGHGANLSVEGVYAFSTQVFDTDGQWQYVQYYGETGPEQEYITVFARLGGYSGVSSGRACFADLSLTKVDSIPGDIVADLWYREDAYADDGDDTEVEEEGGSGSSRTLLFLIAAVYTAAAAYMIRRERLRADRSLSGKKVSPVCTVCLLALSLALRLAVSWLVEGYMVDVNCFLSWGQTMASVGPAQFYQATSFCDYPPLYTYVLALNSVVSGLFGGSAQVSRVVFRLVPNLCDLAACWILYRILLRQQGTGARVSFLFLAFAAFNPVTPGDRWTACSACCCSPFHCPRYRETGLPRCRCMSSRSW